VSYLHSQGIIHRDLKPTNFMYTSDDSNAELVLIDFGFSRWIEEGESLETRLGTPYYLAPEVLERDYDQRSDYWSLGIMMHFLLTGRHPFVGVTTPEVLKEIKEAELSLEGPEWAALSSEAKDLLKKLLTKNPLKRITAVEALLHPWIKMGENSALPAEPVPMRTFKLSLISASTTSGSERFEENPVVEEEASPARGTWMTTFSDSSPVIRKKINTMFCERELGDSPMFSTMDSATTNHNSDT